MKKFVNRRTRDYHAERLQSITELDKIASFVLALTWSRSHNPWSNASQRLIQMDCVACIVVDGELWLASNEQNISSEDLAILAEELGDKTNIWIVTNGSRMHAEMQLVSQLEQEGKLGQPFYLGVSKPCCDNCRRVLDKYNIQYTNWHNSAVKNWEQPF